MEAVSVPRMECTSGHPASKHRGPALLSLTGGVSQGKCRKLFIIYMSLRNLWFHLAPKTLLLGSQVAFKKITRHTNSNLPHPGPFLYPMVPPHSSEMKGASAPHISRAAALSSGVAVQMQMMVPLQWSHDGAARVLLPGRFVEGF